MAQRTRTQHKALYGAAGTTFPDNTTGEISEGDMRNFGEDGADSMPFTLDDSYTWPFPQVTASGTDTYTATLSPAITAYVVGQKFQILFTNANTGAATLNLNSVGALVITKNGTTALSAGDIQAGSIKILTYDGTRLQIIGGGGGTSIPFGATTGTNTYAITASPAVTSYTDGGLYHIRVGTTSTGVVTLNFDSVGAKKLLLTDGSQAADQHVIAGVDYLVAYNSALDSAAGAFVVVNELQHGLMNARGDYDASSNLFPSAGGSGVSGGIRHGDTFRISVAGTLGGTAVNIGDFITTSVDAPGQTASLWYIIPGINSLALKQAIANTATALTDGAAITITGAKHTLTTTQATITFSDSFTGDFTNIDVTFNTTAATWTFPAGSLCVVEGSASGDNTATIAAVSGDKIVISVWFVAASTYRIAVKNFGQ